MKNIILILCFAFLAFEVFAQGCDGELLSNLALQEMPEGYTLIRSFKIDGRCAGRKDIEYTCVFSAGTTYVINIKSADGKAKGIVATLFNDKRQEVATSYHQKRFDEKLSFDCPKVGIYYLRFDFKNNERRCGGAVLSFFRGRAKDKINYIVPKKNNLNNDSIQKPFELQKLAVLEQKNIDKPFVLFPNPSNDILHLKFEGEQVFQAHLYNLQGQIIHSQTFSSSENSLSLKNFASGTYFLYLSQGKLFWVERVVVEK